MASEQHENGETPNITETYVELSDNARAALHEARISSDRIDHVIDLFEKALLEQNVLDSIEENLVREEEITQQHTSPEAAERAVRGLLFESIAIASLPERDPDYAELEQFLLMSLKDTRIWDVDLYRGDPTFSTPEDTELLQKYLRVRPTRGDLWSLRNNDAIHVHTETDASGKVTAIITGVVEAKTYTPKPGSSAERQATAAPLALYETVKRYREALPFLARRLDLGGPGFPTSIDILPPEELEYTIVQPADLEGQNRRYPPQGIFAQAHYQYVDITQDELTVLAKVVSPKIKEAMGIQG